MEKIFLFVTNAADNNLFKVFLIFIIADTVFGCFRSMKQHCFNSCFGIDGAIRKTAMVVSVMFLFVVDTLVSINLIGFIPNEVRQIISCNQVGTAEFFCLLYIAYEMVSILKNMVLCGLPVKKVWSFVRHFLQKYTDELPDSDGIEENSSAGKMSERESEEQHE